MAKFTRKERSLCHYFRIEAIWRHVRVYLRVQFNFSAKSWQKFSISIFLKQWIISRNSTFEDHSRSVSLSFRFYFRLENLYANKLLRSRDEFQKERKQHQQQKPNRKNVVFVFVWHRCYPKNAGVCLKFSIVNTILTCGWWRSLGNKKKTVFFSIF